MSETEADSLVLLIEDEEDMAELVGTLLRKARFKTAIAHSAWKGIAMAEELHPKVIILDLMLSRLDGFEVLKRLKDPPLTSSIPVIILTGKTDQSSCIRALELGADDYITKPFNNRELLLRLKAVLRRYQPVVGSLSAGDLVVDPFALRVRVKGRPLDLALIEFKLLCVLMSRPGEIIAREELLETVWGKDAGVDIRSVDTYVYRVRTKLGDQGAMMQTVRGHGYVFMKSDQYPVPANAAS
jgi:two-component system phosphate regulon response regulator PhoB